jgi:hypothetical protein
VLCRRKGRHVTEVLFVRMNGMPTAVNTRIIRLLEIEKLTQCTFG